METELLTEKNTRLALSIARLMRDAEPGTNPVGALLTVRLDAPDQTSGPALLYVRRGAGGALEAGLLPDARGDYGIIEDDEWVTIEPMASLDDLLAAWGEHYADARSVQIMYEFLGVMVEGVSGGAEQG